MERRKKGHRQGPKAVLVVCEGHTEENMVTREKVSRKISSITILNTKGASPSEIVATAKRRFHEDGGYEKVFCIFDRDSHGSFKKVIQDVLDLSGSKRKNNRIPIKAIISNPCIEIWLMCHFEIPKSTYCSSSKNVKAELKKYLSSYEENDPAVFRMIESKQPKAIDNANSLEKQNNDPLEKPFTNVHKFLELLC